MSPDHSSRAAVDQLAHFVLQCARNDPGLLSRSNFDAIGTATPRRRRSAVAAVSVAGVLAASAALAFHGYDHHAGIPAAGMAAAANAPPGLAARADAPSAGTPWDTLYSHDRSPDAAADMTALAGAPSAPTAGPIVPGQQDPVAGSRLAGPAMPPSAEALPEAQRTDPPQPASAAHPEGTGKFADAAPDQSAAVHEPRAETLHQHDEADEPRAPAARLPRRHVTRHPYRQPARRFVSSRYYRPGPAAILAQVVNNVRRNIDAIFH